MEQLLPVALYEGRRVLWRGMREVSDLGNVFFRRNSNLFYFISVTPCGPSHVAGRCVECMSVEETGTLPLPHVANKEIPCLFFPMPWRCRGQENGMWMAEASKSPQLRHILGYSIFLAEQHPGNSRETIPNDREKPNTLFLSSMEFR